MTTIERPTQGEKTGPQARADTVDLWSRYADETENIGGERVGFRPAPSDTPQTYKRMRAHPTLFLARTAINSPILAADDPTIDAELPEKVTEAVDRLIHDYYWPYVNHALTAIDFGFAGFEKVWSGTGRDMRIVKVKPLSPTKTEPVADDSTGEFVGIKQGNTILPPAASAWYTNDSLAGDLWGTSRLFGLRNVWQWWHDAMQQTGNYLNKIAGVVPIIEYPSGESQMQTGGTISNFEVATRLARGLAGGKAVVMPNTLADYMKDFARAGIKPNEIKAWTIQFLEAKGDHSSGMLEVARQLDKYLLRGYAVPERAVTEGTHGTLAEADSHGNIAFLSAQQSADTITDSFVDQVVRHEILFRFGEDAAKAVVLRAPAVIDETRAYLGSIIDKLIAGAGLELIAPMLDLRNILERRGLPTLEEPSEPVDPAPLATMVRALWERAANAGGAD